MQVLPTLVRRQREEGSVIIIGIGSRARNGKDTAGEAIKAHYDNHSYLIGKHGLTGGLKTVIMKFAGALYEEARTQHGMAGKDPILLQNIGMARRAEDPDYWVNKAFASIPTGTNLAIFTDVRFKNEAEAIKAKGGHLIEVIRLNEDGTRYYSADRPKDHPSETELDGYNWDFYIQSKTSALTGELAVTTAEFIRSLETK